MHSVETWEAAQTSIASLLPPRSDIKDAFQAGYQAGYERMRGAVAQAMAHHTQAKLDAEAADRAEGYFRWEFVG